MKRLVSSNLFINILSIVLLLVIWQICYVIANESLVFPSLSSLGNAAVKTLTTEKFWQTYYYTIETLCEAWIISVALCGITVCLCLVLPYFRLIFTRWCDFFMPLPSFATVPFFSLFFGLHKTTMILVMVYSVYWFSCYQALGIFDTAKQGWSKHIKNLRWGVLKSVFLVYIPAATPSLMSLNATSWTYIWRTLITLEIAYGSIGGYFGLGSYLIDVKNKLDIDVMYVILISIALTGMVINMFFNFITKGFKND